MHKKHCLRGRPPRVRPPRHPPLHSRWEDAASQHGAHRGEQATAARRTAARHGQQARSTHGAACRCPRPAATAPASRRLRAAGRAGRRRRRRPPQRGARAQALQHARGSTAARRRGCTNQAGEGGPGRGSTCRGRERGEQGGQVRRGRGLAQLRERAQLARGRRAQRGLPAGQLRERGRQNGGQRRPDPAPQRRRRPCLGRACRAQVKKEGLGSVCRTGRGDAPHRAGSDTGRECGRGSRVPTCGHVGHVRQGCSEVLRRPCDSATQGNS